MATGHSNELLQLFFLYAVGLLVSPHISTNIRRQGCNGDISFSVIFNNGRGCVIPNDALEVHHQDKHDGHDVQELIEPDGADDFVAGFEGIDDEVGADQDAGGEE